MGIYMLDVEEIEEKLEDFLHSLEGDFATETFCNAFNNIATREKWDEVIFSKKYRKSKKSEVKDGKKYDGRKRI